VREALWGAARRLSAQGGDLLCEASALRLSLLQRRGQRRRPRIGLLQPGLHVAQGLLPLKAHPPR
jgi:hypothetical protein